MSIGAGTDNIYRKPGNKNGPECSPNVKKSKIGEQRRPVLFPVWMRMKLIADSGATKTAWRSVDGKGNVRKGESIGLNPNCLDTDAVKAAFRSVMPSLNPEGERVEEVFFYGAGLVSEETTWPVRECLEMWCPMAEVTFCSDMLAAARALFGNGSGIVAIMGTGSNSCLYENGEIAGNIRPGGYILGDEGSAAYLGKSLLADFIKGLMPGHIEKEFIKEYSLDYPTIVRKVYREPAASAFMASFAPFVTSRQSEPYMQGLLEDCFEGFMRRSLSRYSLSEDGPRKVGVVGSFGRACEPLLREMAPKYGLEFVKFLKSPIDELVKYHGV